MLIILPRTTILLGEFASSISPWTRKVANDAYFDSSQESAPFENRPRPTLLLQHRAESRSRVLLTMRRGGVLPDAATTAPAQHISSEFSVAAVERSRLQSAKSGQRWSGRAPNHARFGSFQYHHILSQLPH